MTTHDFLKRVNIFSDCSEKELQTIGEHCAEIEVDEGATLFKEGDEGQELYIVKSGLVKTIIRTLDGSEREITQFGTGDFFGEMSIVDDAPRSATCRADKKSVLFKMHERDFYNIMQARPGASIKIMYKMLNITTQRLKTTSRLIADMVRWGNDASRRAVTDEVTGAYNRRYLDHVLSDCFTASQASGKPFSLIMMDLDHFREINEAHNHEVGNMLLCRVVETMKQTLLPTDILARYGGDEFTILLPETTLPEASQRAEKIRSDVENLKVELAPGKVLAVTTSQGIAGFPETATDLDTIKKTADQALYKAKESGRNRVVCASSTL